MESMRNDESLSIVNNADQYGSTTDDVERLAGGVIVESLVERKQYALIIGIIIVNGIALISEAYGLGQNMPALVGLIIWLYVLVLAVLQEALPMLRWRRLKLWNHLTAIYAFQGVFDLILFWSAITHPKSKFSQILTISETIMTSSLLFIIGARTQNIDAELLEAGDLEPSQEPRASLFSMAVFSWLDDLLLKGFRTGLEIHDIWDLPPKLKAFVRASHPTKPWLDLLDFRIRPLKPWLYSFFSTCFGFAPVIFLKNILECIKYPDDVRTIMRLNVILIAVAQVLGSLLQEQFLWLVYNVGFQVEKLYHFCMFEALTRTAAEAKVGTIINNVSVDTSRVAEDSGSFNQLMPLVVAISIGISLLWHILGPSSIPGLVIMVGSMLTTSWLGQRALSQAQKELRAATDRRLNTTNETLENIRIVKLTAMDRVSKITSNRDDELGAWRRLHLIKGSRRALRDGMLVLAEFLSFHICMLVEKPLYSSVVFTALPLFRKLQKDLNNFDKENLNISRGKIANSRIEEFLNQQEMEKCWFRTIDEESDKIVLSNAAFCWARDGASAFHLSGINVKFGIGLNTISGGTGSGKTSLIMAILGEVTKIKGDIYLPQAGSPHIGYCSQKAWLLNGSIRDNITIGGPWDRKRYEEVVNACALKPELERFKYGDETSVGENGAMLSGGQKQLIALARATYSSAGILLLDDCLSSLDSHTAKWVLEKCLMGRLMRDRICILATHSIPLCLQFSKYVVVLENGKVVTHGTAEEVVASGRLGADFDKNKPAFEDVLGSSEIVGIPRGTSQPTITNGRVEDGRTSSIDGSEVEPYLKGKVVYFYLKSMSSWSFWVLGIVLFGADKLLDIAPDYWIRQLANQDDEPRLKSTSQPSRFVPVFDAKYKLVIYALIRMVGVLVNCFRYQWTAYGSRTAGSHINDESIKSVLNAKLAFFCDNPLGQFLNLFSADLDYIDRKIAFVMMDVIDCAFDTLIKIVIVSIVIPSFLLAAAVIGVLFLLVGAFYIKSSRDLKKLESEQKGQISQLFSETHIGIVTIRAYGLGQSFCEAILQRSNSYIGPRYLRCAANRWLTIRLDSIGALVTLSIGSFAIYHTDTIDEGTLGLILSYAIRFTSSLYPLIKAWVNLEQGIIHLVRILGCLKLDQEATDQEKKPLGNWPSQGSVEFVRYTTSYRPDLKPVLQDINFTIRPGQKVGIVGPTGAGKSSIALAFFRILEASDGQILIDGEDISTIPIEELRKRIAIVPQQPELFEGTISSNLDPDNKYTDRRKTEVLELVQFWDTTENILSTQVSNSGQKLSRGQIQQLCLAQALLKDPTILVMDEATASTDHGIDAKIHEMIHGRKNTTIIIAHRLVTVIKCDVIIVLKDGKVVESGNPHDLLKKEGDFKTMCMATGNFGELKSAAKSAYWKNKLIDDE